MDRICLLFTGLLLFIISCKKTFEEPILPSKPDVSVVDDTSSLKNYDREIIIVNWNLEWFGAPEFRGDPALQEANAGKILQYLNADLYGICEVVDTARFGKMVRSALGDAYRYVISPYVNVAQKMALVYNRHIFRNVQTRAFLGLSAHARVNFAYGRFPFQLDADLVMSGVRVPITVYLLHAKAGSSFSSYKNRLDGSEEMKDSLDALGDRRFIVIGDFNDNFDGSITYRKPSPYRNFMDDTIRYLSVTLPLNVAGCKSTISYENSVIDQQIASALFGKWYVNASAKIRTDVKTVVNDYDQRNTSDHYPVSSRYRVTH